jgi:hypothetical protein
MLRSLSTCVDGVRLSVPLTPGLGWKFGVDHFFYRGKPGAVACRELRAVDRLNDLAVEGTFVWSNGDAVTYTHWNGGQPDDFHSSEDCAQMRTDGYWNDLNCTGTRAYVCER